MLISAIAASMKPKPKKLLTVKKEKKSTAPTPASLKRMKENALAQTRAQEATEGVGCFGFPDVCVFLFFPKCVCVCVCYLHPCSLPLLGVLLFRQVLDKCEDDI